ncbi:MAG: family F420-dependent class oxidoreductase, partial [Pseudonocardiales bacterium]|nr:family F420-dependent class oxidoreductase [Pseudonocardiales bacterium]
MRPTVGRIGIWARPSNLSAELAHAVESMGYGTIWIGSSPAADLRMVDDLLAATETVVLATGIVNIWT